MKNNSAKRAVCSTLLFLLLGATVLAFIISVARAQVEALIRRQSSEGATEILCIRGIARAPPL